MRVLELILSKNQQDRDISAQPEKDKGLQGPEAKIQYELYDRRTGQKVGKNCTTKNGARNAVDRLDNAYGGYRYGYREILVKPSIPRTPNINEAVHKLPLIEDDYDKIKELMEKPIPAAMARIYIHEVIVDDEFDDMLQSLEESDPNRDIRPLIAEWMNRVMPDQMYRFGIGEQTQEQKDGRFSLIHGYDPHEYHGQSMETSGNAYGKR